MLNLTITLLSLKNSFGRSPIVASSIRSNTIIGNSRFTNFVSPILFTKIKGSKLLMKNIFVANAENCVALPIESSATTLSQSCYIASYYNILNEYENTYYYDFDNTEVTITGSIFENCYASNAGLSVIHGNSISFYMDNCTAISCGPSFGIFSNPFNNSYIKSSTFINCGETEGSIFSFDQGRFSFSDVTFMINNTHTPICISVSNSIVSINDTLFNQTVENTTVISSAGSMELLLSTCDFMSFSKITLRTYTFAMLYSCCFSGLESNAIDIDSTSKYSLNDVNFNQSCPINSATASLSSEKKAYAIVTIVVFFFCFAALFIALITLVFCKIGGDDTAKYGLLHDEEGGEDQDSSDITD
ncbi:hypothetical protein GPJ56_000230 [Histomonas meleagridis]|uniref:uncharacterized protein n=1 Tax=Histomonas meleagridis TaxID=135588 RepID=UPI00355A30F0|nr:hypothetical protein GPJ56_000230 [Histomonas meleagridis]KAH0799717.1 hypothetical protein GO595_007438 [Histomonas meleagridis]